MRTFTCIIVDDEALILQRLEMMFHKLKQYDRDFVLIGKASSADEGITLANQLKPDIIITDVVMPGMDGVTMIGELKKRLPRAEFIILSAYPDFNYAKSAMAMNVLDYLVKVPLRQSDLYAALDKARAKVLANEEQDTKVHRLQVTVQGNIHLLHKQAMEELLHGQISPAALKKRSKELVIDFQFKAYSCVVVRMDEYRKFKIDFSTGDQKTIKYGMLNIINELSRNEDSSFACEIGESRFVCFISWSEIHSAAQIESKAYEMARSICTSIKKYLNQSVSVGVSRPVHGWDAIASAYEEADNTLMDTFYLGFGSVVTAARIRIYEDKAIAEAEACVQDLLENLFLTNKQDIEGIDRLIAIINKKKAHPKKLIAIVERLFVQIDYKFARWKGAKTPLHSNDIGHITHSEQLVEYIEKKYNDIRMGMSLSNERTEISRVKQYIEVNLKGRLTLQQAADHVNMNVSYFSEVFKKEVKEGFADYVNRKRIELAVQLLQTRNYSNAELAEAVGITSETYFCTVFKKYTGVSPQKFKFGIGK